MNKYMITKVREESLTRPNMRGGKDTADYTYYIQLRCVFYKGDLLLRLLAPPNT